MIIICISNSSCSFFMFLQLMSRHLVFLYGTLKKGQPNEYLIKDLKDVKYIGRAVTCQAYPLIIRAEWRLPHLLKVEGKGKVSMVKIVCIGTYRSEQTVQAQIRLLL